MSKNEKITIEQDLITNREDEAMEFLKKIFFIDSALITDITELADFTYTGLTEAQSDKFKNILKQPDSNKEAVKYWDSVILARVKEEYDIELKTVCVTLLSVLDQIQEKKDKIIH